MRSKIEIHKVNKTFIQNDSEATEVLKDIDLDIREGEFICLLGHSGCGKAKLISTEISFPVPLLIKALFFRIIVFSPGLPWKKTSDTALRTKKKAKRNVSEN